MSSILASLLQFSESFKGTFSNDSGVLQSNIKELHSNNSIFTFHNILIELMN